MDVYNIWQTRCADVIYDPWSYDANCTSNNNIFHNLYCVLLCFSTLLQALLEPYFSIDLYFLTIDKYSYKSKIKECSVNSTSGVCAVNVTSTPMHSAPLRYRQLCNKNFGTDLCDVYCTLAQVKYHCIFVCNSSLNNYLLTLSLNISLQCKDDPGTYYTKCKYLLKSDR